MAKSLFLVMWAISLEKFKQFAWEHALNVYLMNFHSHRSYWYFKSFNLRPHELLQFGLCVAPGQFSKVFSFDEVTFSSLSLPRTVLPLALNKLQSES
jgi:hypothetical protein